MTDYELLTQHVYYHIYITSNSWHYMRTQREYSSKPVRHSIVKRILVIKR